MRYKTNLTKKMDTMAYKIYAVRIITREPGAAPKFLYMENGRLIGFPTRQGAELYMEGVEREAGCHYSVVYGMEYTNRVMDANGMFTISTFAELPEPGEKGGGTIQFP